MTTLIAFVQNGFNFLAPSAVHNFSKETGTEILK